MIQITFNATSWRRLVRMPAFSVLALGIFAIPATAREPDPHEVIFYQDTGFQGKNDAIDIKSDETYMFFRPDDTLSTRHFIKSVKVGSQVGVMLLYDNFASSARPRTLICNQNRANLGDLNWFVLKVIIFNRDVVEFPEGVRFGNRPTSQPPGDRREAFVLVNQSPPPVEVFARHNLRHAHLYGPSQNEIQSPTSGKALETWLTMEFAEPAGTIKFMSQGQIFQGVWQTHGYTDVSQYGDLKRLQSVTVTGSERLFRKTNLTPSPGQPMVPKGALTSPSKELKADPETPGLKPLSPKPPPGIKAMPIPSQQQWASPLGTLTLTRAGNLVSGTMETTGQPSWLVTGSEDATGMQLAIWRRGGKPQGALTLSFDSSGKSAQGKWESVDSATILDMAFTRK